MSVFIKSDNAKLTFSSRAYRVDNEKSGSDEFLRDNSETYKTHKNGVSSYVFAISDGFSEKHVLFADKASRAAVSQCREGLDLLDESDDESIEDSIADIFRRVIHKIRAMQQVESIDINATLTAGFFIQNRMHVGHVGNCRVYRHKNDKFEQITADQPTFLPPPSGKDLIRNESPDDKVELEPPSIYFYRFDPEPKEIVLFCTDGVYKILTNDEMRLILSSTDSPAKICERLIDRVRLRNPDDDASVVLIRFDSIAKIETFRGEREEEGKKEEFLPSKKKPFLIILFFILILSLTPIYYFINQKHGAKISSILSFLKRDYPRVSIDSGINLKSVKYNTKEIKPLFKNNKGAIKLKTDFSSFEIDPEGIYTLRLEYPKSANVEVNSGNENIINIDGNFVGIWLNPDSSVKIDKSTDSKKTVFAVKSIEKGIKINLLTPEDAKINIKGRP